MKKNKYTIGIDARMYGVAQTGIGTYIEYLIKNFIMDKNNPDIEKLFLAITQTE